MEFSEGWGIFYATGFLTFLLSTLMLLLDKFDK